MSTPGTADDRPNLLLITADDMNGDTPGFLGGPAGVTPTLDRLAAEGTAFARAHVAVAVCQPSRSAIMTGRWPHRNGAEGFEPIHDGVPILTELLKPAGYRTGILSKVDHLAPVDRFGWDFVRRPDQLGMGRDPHAYGAAVAGFLRDAEQRGRPWFLMANANDPHRPFHGSDDERGHFSERQLRTIATPSKVFTSAQAEPPGFLPDLPDVRREVAEYLSSCRRCDDVVAAALGALDESGQADRTMVAFLSDNGMAFPFAKANCYLQSTRTPLIVRWPGHARAGRLDGEHFVSTLDLFPTWCEAAGVPTPDGTDGRSLRRLLGGHREAGRNRVVTVFHETHAKRRFEMRCVQDAEYGYIYNAWADGETSYQAENMFGRSWRAITAAADTDPAVARRATFYLRRTPEELYHLATDPHALRNLADSAEHRDRLDDARAHLARWMADVGDPLANQGCW